MKLIFLVAFLGTASAQSPLRPPQRNYLTPAANGFGGGSGFGRGSNSGGGNSFRAGGGNGFQRFNGVNGLVAQASGGFGSVGFNGGSNGFVSDSNRFSNGRGSANGNGPSSAYGAPGAKKLAELSDSLPGGGVPGEDFPVLSEVPETGFQCGDQAVSGYYADVDDAARCQVFHICQLRDSGQGQQDSFLCPNGTIFNQQYLVCDWWFNFNCSTAEGFYSVNELIGQDSTTQYNLDQALSSANFAFGDAGANGINGFQARPGFNANGAFGSNLGQTVSGGGNFGSSGYTSGNAFGTGGGAAGGNGRRPGLGNGRRPGISNGGGRRSGGNRPSGGRGGAGGNGRGYSYL